MTATVYRYVLEEAAFESFVQLDPEERDLVQAYFRWIASNPRTTGQGFYTDSTGRLNYASLCGPFLIVHWTDDAVREVRIVQLRRD
ncbi:MAG: hypothetical protein EXS38_07380 [Opitutus sp.]|nr:hypothetical protein [Opitutus sp.]